VGKRAPGRQQIVGIAKIERLELAPHATVFFDRRLEPLLEGGNTVFVIARRVIS
jgi:hypothetical protein